MNQIYTTINKIGNFAHKKFLFTFWLLSCSFNVAEFRFLLCFVLFGMFAKLFLLLLLRFHIQIRSDQIHTHARNFCCVLILIWDRQMLIRTAFCYNRRNTSPSKSGFVLVDFSEIEFFSKKNAIDIKFT